MNIVSFQNKTGQVLKILSILETTDTPLLWALRQDNAPTSNSSLTETHDLMC
jgi:hypothetical protein